MLFCYSNFNFSLTDLRQGLKNLQSRITKEEETSKNVHKSNLHSLINCVNALDELYLKIDAKINDEKEYWPMTKVLAGKVFF